MPQLIIIDSLRTLFFQILTIIKTLGEIGGNIISLFGVSGTINLYGTTLNISGIVSTAVILITLVVGFKFMGQYLTYIVGLGVVLAGITFYGAIS